MMASVHLIEYEDLFMIQWCTIEISEAWKHIYEGIVWFVIQENFLQLLSYKKTEFYKDKSGQKY